MSERRLLAIAYRERLERVLKVMLDENEFLSPHGIRALSRYHKDSPYILHVNGIEHRVDYEPGESTSGIFGGNSNWRGPVWFPVNFLLIESLQRFYHYYGDDFKVECPTGSGTMMNLWEVSQEISRRLSHIFLKDENGRRPVFGTSEKLPDRSVFSRPRALPRVFSRRHRPRPRSVPPNRLDRPGRKNFCSKAEQKMKPQIKADEYMIDRYHQSGMSRFIFG